MNIDKGHNVFVNSDKFFVYFYCPASHMKPPLPINAFTLILANSWLYNYVKNLQGVKEYLKILIKKLKRQEEKFHFSLFELLEKYTAIPSFKL